MSVLLTLIVMAAAGAYLLAAYRRLIGLREQVTLAWKKLEADQTNEAVKTVYNRHVKSYNDALDGFPGYLLGPLAGLKPARYF